MTRRASVAPVVAATIASVLFGASFVATRFLAVRINPLSLAAARQMIGAACFAPVWFSMRSRRPSGPDLTRAVLLGALFFGFLPLAVSLGLSQTAASRGGLIIGLNPVLTLILATALGVERWCIKNTTAVMLALAGAAIASHRPGLAPGHYLDFQSGDAFMLIAAICAATYNVFSKPLLREYPAMLITSYSMFAGAAILLPIGVASGMFSAVAHLDVREWLILAFLGVGTSAVAFFLWLWALSKLPPTRIAIFFNANPISAAILGALLLDETLPSWFVAGLGLVVAGVLLANLRQRTVSTEKEAPST